MTPDRKSLSADIARLIPLHIEKGIYYRLYRRKDESLRLVWWVKTYDRQGRPIYESSGSGRYEDAVKLHKKIAAQVDLGATRTRSGSDNCSTSFWRTVRRQAPRRNTSMASSLSST